MPRPGTDFPASEQISVRVQQAAKITGLSKSKIYLLIASGDIQAAKVGRATVVMVDSLRAYLQSRRITPRSPR